MKKVLHIIADVLQVVIITAALMIGFIYAAAYIEDTRPLEKIREYVRSN